MFRHARRAHAATAIARHGVIDKFGISEFQLIHDLDELFQRTIAAQAGIARLFLTDSGDTALLVIVCGVDERIVGIRKQFAAHRML